MASPAMGTLIITALLECSLAHQGMVSPALSPAPQGTVSPALGTLISPALLELGPVRLASRPALQESQLCWQAVHFSVHGQYSTDIVDCFYDPVPVEALHYATTELSGSSRHGQSGLDGGDSHIGLSLLTHSPVLLVCSNRPFSAWPVQHYCG